MEGDIYLRTNMIWNYLLGAKPTKFKNPFYNKIHNVYAKFWLMSGMLLIASLYYQFAYMKGADAQIITENLRITFLISFSIAKYFRMQSVLAVRIVDYIRRKEQEYIACSDTVINSIFREHVVMNHRICQFFMVFGYFTLAFFELHPVMYEYINPPDAKFDIIDNVTVYLPRPLPFGGEFPFDKYKYYGWAYGFHAWTGIFCCAVTITPDNFYYALMIFAAMETKILKHRLKNFRKLALEDTSTDSNYRPNRTIQHETRLIVAFLRECIILHKDIIEYVEDLNVCIRNLMLVDSVLTSVQMAVIGFGLIVLPFGITAFVAFEYLLWTIAQLFFFYWFANEIVLEGLSIQDAIWESEWYDCSPPVKKLLILVVMRSQKPMALFVGPFYQMSVETMISILKTAFSYFALMRQMYT